MRASGHGAQPESSEAAGWAEGWVTGAEEAAELGHGLRRGEGGSHRWLRSQGHANRPHACSCTPHPACGVATVCGPGQNQRAARVHTETLRGRCPPSQRGSPMLRVTRSAGGAPESATTKNPGWSPTPQAPVLYLTPPSAWRGLPARTLRRQDTRDHTGCAQQTSPVSERTAPRPRLARSPPQASGTRRVATIWLCLPVQ